MIGYLPNFFKDPHALGTLSENEPLLLALSGGADSSALLDLLCRLKKERNFALYAAHVNHSIRTAEYNDEAARDENFCKELCSSLGVTLFTANIDVPAFAKDSGQSLETAAREARYSFFAEIMKKNGIKTLVTAHNADDNLETQIFNLCRGCGIEGICGIPEVRGFDAVEGGKIVRPILSASKREIIEYCNTFGVRFVTDSTNLETDCTRNRIRHNILPELRAIFNSPEKAGLRLAGSALEDSNFIVREAESFLKDFGGVLYTSKLNTLSPAVAKRAIRIVFSRVADEKLEAIHTEELLKFSKMQKDGKISLPGKICAVFSNGILSFSDKPEAKSEEIEYSVPLCDGINTIPNSDFLICVSRDTYSPETIANQNEIYSLHSYAYLKVSDSSPLTATTRREGDVILDGGMHKKLKKLMCDKKIPKESRSHLPIIRQNGNVLYVPKCAVADTAKAKKTNADLVISIYQLTNN